MPAAGRPAAPPPPPNSGAASVAPPEAAQANRRVFQVPLSSQRYQWVQQFVAERPQIRSLTDVGCGSGRLVNWLKCVAHLERLQLLDSDLVLLEFELEHSLRPGVCELLFGRNNSQLPLAIQIFHGDIGVPDPRLQADCFTLVEVVEHMEPEQVARACRLLFGHYRPRYVLATTPNCEFNHLLEAHHRQPGAPAAPPRRFRHADHKFEWSRAQFAAWAGDICARFGYSCSFHGVGHLPNSEPFGPCTQIAAFERLEPGQPAPTATANEDNCLDLMINKLGVGPDVPDWKPDWDAKKVSLLESFVLPANKSYNDPDEQAAGAATDNWTDWATCN